MKKVHSKEVFVKLSAIFIVAVLAVGYILTFSLSNSQVYADDPIVVDITAPVDDTTQNPGDIIVLNIVASHVDHITRFGPISLAYDPAQMDYLSVSQPTLLSAFTYNVDSSTPGNLLITAINETVEADLDAAAAEGYEFEDNSLTVEEELILCTVSFRIMSTSSDSVDVHIEDLGEFVDSSKTNVQTAIGNGDISIAVSKELSPDANLAFLTVNGYTLTPEFSSDVTDYSISVSRDSDNVQVSAIPVNLWSTVVITGNTRLEPGDNVITIDVTAQDGVNTNVYYIHASKQEVYTTEGAGLVDYDGKVYTFVTMPPDYFVPDGFIEMNKVINGYSVPVLARDGVESVLVYVSDGESDPAFFFYNPSTKIVTPYVPVATTIITSKILFRSELPEDKKLPEGFSASTLYSKGSELEGYVNDDGVFICYMVDELGQGAFYKYNVETGEFSEYNSVNKSGTSAYQFFFHVFLFATVLEAVIIVLIVFIVQYNINKRKNPRPKRV